MKTKKSAVTAALKPTDKKITSKTTTPKAAVTKVQPETGKTTSAPITAPTPPQATTADAKTAETVTTIDVKVDVGVGNTVYLRGQGSGLTWEHGVPLACIDGGTWRWTQPLTGPITFKVLLNDQVWSAGSDLVAAPGQKLEVSPCFS